MLLESSLQSIALVEDFLVESVGDAFTTNAQFHNLTICTLEAVNNAIFHGNKLDSSKQVQVDVAVTEYRVVVRVRDSGAGFDHNAIPDPRLPENLTREGGRGVFLIKQLANEFTFLHSDAGMLVEFSFHRT